MNYCTKCECFFRQPGTCNCFAVRTEVVTQPQYVPYIPTVTVPPSTSPYVIPYYKWSTDGNIC